MFLFLFFFSFQFLHPPCATLFPYTSLFRSVDFHQDVADALRLLHVAGRDEVGDDGVEGLGVVRLEPQRGRSEEHTSELQSPCNLVCRLLLEKKKRYRNKQYASNCSSIQIYT